MKKMLEALKSIAFVFGIIILIAVIAVQAKHIAHHLMRQKSNSAELQSVLANPLENQQVDSDYSGDNDENGIIISEYYGDENWLDFVLGDNNDTNESDAQTEQTSATIRQMTYGIQDGGHFVKLTSGAQVKNCTTQTTQCLYAQSNLLPDYTIDIDGSIQVLIIHTHTTEGYEPFESGYFDENSSACTTDSNLNVIAVGQEIKAELEKSGIGVIHDTTYHDYPSHTGCYGRCAQTIQDIMAQYPSIKVVLDIHRDSITALDGARIAPVIEIDGKTAAQAMIISGCDDGTLGMPDYMQNFRLACLIQNYTEKSYKGLMRPILFDYCKYNQDISTGYLTIEVGSAANSLEQAKYTGKLLGKSIADALLSIKTQ